MREDHVADVRGTVPESNPPAPRRPRRRRLAPRSEHLHVRDELAEAVVQLLAEHEPGRESAFAGNHLSKLERGAVGRPQITTWPPSAQCSPPARPTWA